MDTKGDIRVHCLSGSDADWDSFRLKFEACTDHMGAAENEINPIDKATLSNQDAINC